ncbi:hypothetical protein ACE4RR_12750 [Alteribacillus sp. HJP-4]
MKAVVDVNQRQGFEYKLTIAGNDVIQAAISFEYRDGYVLVENLESANWGKESKSGIYVAPTMLAAVCQLSVQAGYEGFVLITSKHNKKNLMDYYAKLGAQQIGSTSRMAINEVTSQKLIDVYLTKGGGSIHGGK